MNGAYYNEITSKLDKYIKKEHLVFFTVGLLRVIIIALSVFFLFSLLEMLFHFSSNVRTVLFFLFVVSFIAPFSYLFIYPLLKYFYIAWKPDYFFTANKVGTEFPEIRDELYNAMQLHQNKIGLYSGSLIEAAFMQVYNRTKGIRFETKITYDEVKRTGLFTSAVIGLFFILILFLAPLGSAAGRLINFNTEYIPPSKFLIEVHPGNAIVSKGERVFISFKVIGPKPRSASLYLRYNEQTDFEFQRISVDSTGSYIYQVNAVQSSFEYYAQAEDVNSEAFLIEVTDRPVIKQFSIKISPPSYSKMQHMLQMDNGNITSLIGSQVEIDINSSKALQSAFLYFGDSTKKELGITSHSASGKFRLSRDNSYQIFIIDENGDTNSMPVLYDIKALYDAFPSIEVINPPLNTIMSNDSRIPSYIKLSDDYGFSKLLLHYRLSESRYEKPAVDYTRLEIPLNKGGKEEDVNYVWNLSKLHLAADDVITFYYEVFDNDNVSGPKSTKSSLYAVRVPSLDEILSRADDTQKEAVNELSETFKEAEELKKELEKLNQDLKKNQKDISWQEKEKMEKSIEKFQQLQEKIDNINKDLTKMQQELRENNLLSKETMQKYMELQKLMDELTSDEMKKAMEKLQDVMKNLNRQQVQENLEKMKMDEEAFNKSIERTMNLLKRIQIEQKLDELVKRTEEIIKKQDELEKQTKENKNNNKDLAEKQDNLTKEMDKLQEEMKELSERMKDMKDMPKDEADKLESDFEKQENQELSEESSENLKQDQKQHAMEKQKQISKNMKQMKQQMEQLQQSVMQQNQMQTFTDMMRVLENLVSLSKQQEQLKKETESLNPGSTKFNENAQKQSSLQKSLDQVMQKLNEISQKTFAVSPEMGKALGDAMRNMQKSVQEMQNNNRNSSGRSQEDAMGSLNEAASMMKSSMEAMMQGGGQGGMMSLMQQLQKMSGQQMSLNNMMQQLQQGNQGQLSPEQQGQLQRLGQQQELIRKSLEQLNNEAKTSGQSKKLPANLDNINKQMQEVISDIQADKLNPELLQKQERILSRLLDAQRSMNERDYEKERESFSGNNFNRESPADLILNERGKNRIKDELNKAVNEGYRKDYEELIRSYFEALEKQTK